MKLLAIRILAKYKLASMLFGLLPVVGFCQPYAITAITSSYSGTFTSGVNSTVYICRGAGITFQTNMTSSSITSGGKTYDRRWQSSSSGSSWSNLTGYTTQNCTFFPTITPYYYRICYSYNNSSTDLLYTSNWVRVIQGPSFVSTPSSLSLSTTNITNTSFTANWTSSTTVCAGGGLGIMHQIEVSTNSGFSPLISGYPKDVTSCFTNGATSCSYDVTGLTPGQIYYWRIKAKSYNYTTTGSYLYCGYQSSYASSSFFLPVELLDFSAKCNVASVTLSWSTATETNNDYFTIEKSINTEDWVPVGIVDGAGSSNELISYEFEDAEPMSGTSYYRLKQTDFDGKFEYFGPVTVNCDDDATGIIAYPNPAQNNVLIIGSQDVAADVYLCDLTGRIISAYSCSRLSEPFNIDLRNILPGVYLIRVDSQNSSEYFRVVKE